MPILILDLDETILSVNSFRYWVLHLLFGRIYGLTNFKRINFSAKVSATIINNKIFRKGHALLRNNLQGLLKKEKIKNEVFLLGFQEMLQCKIRPCFITMLTEIGEGKRDAVLATAAAEEYAVNFGQKLGFKHIVATVHFAEDNNINLLNDGIEKCNHTTKLLRELSWSERPKVLMTDNITDLPLMELCQKTLWFGDENEMKTIKNKIANVRIVMASNFSAEELVLQSFL